MGALAAESDEAPKAWQALKTAFLEWVTSPRGDAERSAELWRVFAASDWFREELRAQSRRALAERKLPRDWLGDVEHEALLEFADQLHKDPALRVDIDQIDRTFPGWIGERLHLTCGHAIARLERLSRHHEELLERIADPRQPETSDLEIDASTLINSLDGLAQMIALLDLSGHTIESIAENLNLSFAQARRLRDKERHELVRRLAVYRGKAPVVGSSSTPP